MNQVLFISEAKLKQNSDILENVDTMYLRNAILKVQRTKCLGVLGSDLYNKIENLIVNNTIGASGNSVYKNLLDVELQQSIIQFATAEVLLTVSYKITTKGALQFLNENSQPLDLNTIKYMVGRYEDTGEYWLVRMRDYCTQYSKLNQLPEYTNPNYNDDRTIGPDRRTPWSSSLYLKGYPYGSKEFWRYNDNLPNSTPSNNP
jgi:hypothetical protein